MTVKWPVAQPGTTVRLRPNSRFICTCGKEHDLGAWVAAHWYDLLTHTCEECGIKRTLKGGILKTPEETNGPQKVSGVKRPRLD